MSQNKDGRKKDDHNRKINYIVQYDGEEDEAEQCFYNEEYMYASCSTAPEWSWVLLGPVEAAPAKACNMKKVDVDGLSPLDPHPFIRELKQQMDNCTGTNKLVRSVSC